MVATLFTALDAYNCLASVPLNHTVASQFLQYYKDTLEFQSTLTYLKNPPASYQQPPTDLLVGLDITRRQLDTGVFSNEYEFELAVLDLVYSAHMMVIPSSTEAHPMCSALVVLSKFPPSL